MICPSCEQAIMEHAIMEQAIMEQSDFVPYAVQKLPIHKADPFYCPFYTIFRT